MKTLELDVNNPIDLKSIDQLINKIVTSEGYDYLLIDVREHDFKSIEIIKYFRGELEKIRSTLLKFKKIAFVHPPEFQNKSDNPKIFDYFNSNSDAKLWLIS